MIAVDRQTVIQIFGSLMNNPTLLSEVDKYQFDPQDFTSQLDKFIFSAIYNLYAGGAQKIHTLDVDNYLQTNELAKNLMERDNGIAFLQDCETYSEEGNFPYYYNRFKKLILLRELEKRGKNISMFYSEDPLDPQHSAINERFEKLTTADILNGLKSELAILENKYVINSLYQESKAADGIRNLIKELKIKPEVGIKLQGDIFNTITRGGRKGKLYLRSASSGVGKSRSMVGDACNIAYPIRFEPRYNKWIVTGGGEPVLYVMTEQDTAEIQTMILAYLSGFNEEMFLYGTFTEEHMERILKAVDIMETYQDNLRLVHMPDPSASVIKNLFREYAFQYGIQNFFYDYIFSCNGILNEYRDLGVREDVALRLFTTALKNLAVELDAFILTATQISNDDDKKGGFKDMRNIQGSKAIANLVDFGCIMSVPSQEELEEVKGFQKMFNFSPNCITDVFKNRRGRWTRVRIWSRMDLGTCRKYDLFVTTPNNKQIEDFQCIEFTMEKKPDMIELENMFNEGLVYTDEDVNKILSNFEIIQSNEQVVNNVIEAFGDIHERREQAKQKDWDELL